MYLYFMSGLAAYSEQLLVLSSRFVGSGPEFAEHHLGPCSLQCDHLDPIESYVPLSREACVLPDFLPRLAFPSNGCGNLCMSPLSRVRLVSSFHDLCVLDCKVPM